MSRQVACSRSRRWFDWSLKRGALASVSATDDDRSLASTVVLTMTAGRAFPAWRRARDGPDFSALHPASMAERHRQTPDPALPRTLATARDCTCACAGNAFGDVRTHWTGSEPCWRKRARWRRTLCAPSIAWRRHRRDPEVTFTVSASSFTVRRSGVRHDCSEDNGVETSGFVVRALD